MACGRISGSDGRLRVWSLSVHRRRAWVAEVGRMWVRSGILHLSSFYDLRASRFSLVVLRLFDRLAVAPDAQQRVGPRCHEKSLMLTEKTVLTSKA